MARFTKAGLIEMLEERAEILRKKHKFDPTSGWAQVEDRETDVIVDYGRYDELSELILELSA